MFNTDSNIIGFGPVFHALPGLYLVISPGFVILDATDAYLRATLQERHALIGRYVFDVFPNNPATPGLDSTCYLKQSLEYVLEHKQVHYLPSMRYDIPCPDEMGGGFTEKYWSTVSTPVLDEAGNLTHIIHETRNITEKLAGELIQMHRKEQESLLNSAIEAVSWEFNFKTNILNWGTGLKEIFGFLPEEAGNTLASWKEKVHPDDIAAVTQSLDAATVAQSKIWTGEYRFLKADGTYAEVLDQSYLIYEASGQPLLGIGTIINISKSKRAEQYLKESDARFRHLLEVLPHMAWTAEPNGRNLYFNRSWYSYTGIPEGYAQSWIQVIHPEDSAYALTTWHEALASCTMFEIEMRIRNNFDGRYRWHLERAMPMPGPDGKVKLWIGTFTDIDDQKEVIKQLRLKDQRLENILKLSPAHSCLLQGPNHICKFVTPGIYTLYGNRSYLGRPARDIWPELENTSFSSLLDQVYHNGKVISIKERHQFLESGGKIQEAYFYFKYQPIQDAEGNIEGILLSAVEVTELVRAKQKVEALRYAMKE